MTQGLQFLPYSKALPLIRSSRTPNDPPEGRKYLTAQLSTIGNTGQLVPFGYQTSLLLDYLNSGMSQCAGVIIDNSSSNGAMVISVQDTGQIITVPAHYYHQGPFYTGANPSTIVVNGVGSNYPIPFTFLNWEPTFKEFYSVNINLPQDGYVGFSYPISYSHSFAAANVWENIAGVQPYRKGLKIFAFNASNMPQVVYLTQADGTGNIPDPPNPLPFIATETVPPNIWKKIYDEKQTTSDYPLYPTSPYWGLSSTVSMTLNVTEYQY